MTQPGDSIMTLPPVYYPFFSAVTANDRKLVLCPLRREGERYEMDYADMEEKMASEHVRMLIFCSPHNPVGRVWTREELEKLVKLCRKHNVTIVSDEIHQDFVFAPAKHIPLATLEPNAVTLTAPSKTFNLAGMQTAVAIIPQDSIREKWDAFTKRLHLNSGSTFGYLAGEAAYLHGAPWLEELKQIIHGNYLFLREKLLAALQCRSDTALTAEDLLTGILHNRLGRVLTKAAGVSITAADVVMMKSVKSLMRECSNSIRCKKVSLRVRCARRDENYVFCFTASFQETALYIHLVLH